MHAYLSGFFRNVRSLIKLVSPFKFFHENSSMCFSFVVALKSSRNNKFWYFLLHSSMMQLRHSRSFDMKFLLRLYEPLIIRFLFVKLISAQMDSMLKSDLRLRNFEVISSRIWNKSPPPLEFLSNLYQRPYSFKINCAEGNESSGFVPSNKIMSTFSVDDIL